MPPSSAPLRASPLLAGLDPAARAEVLSRAGARELARGTVLFRQDEAADALYLVERGRVRLSQLTPAGQEVLVRLCGPGEVFAGIAALDGRTYPFTAEAASAACVLRFARAELRDLFRRVPDLERNVLDIVGGHAREMLDRYRELATEPVPQRIARTLLRLAGGETRVDGITRRDLAEMSGTTLFTVSRTLAAWQRRGLLHAGRERIEIRAGDGLRDLAGLEDADPGD